MQVAELGLCCFRVDLTHVTPCIWALDIFNVEVPSPVLVMGDFDPWVSGNDMGLDSEDSRPFEMDPCHLEQEQKNEPNFREEKSKH